MWYLALLALLCGIVISVWGAKKQQDRQSVILEIKAFLMRGYVVWLGRLIVAIVIAYILISMIHVS
jgi:hypothetical protein